MSRNFTADVDTQREYFNATYFNNSGQNQIAKYDTTLLKPFFTNPDQWKLAINRMRVPLSGIPLTKNNIPFQQWEVGIQYQTAQSGGTQSLSLNYVPQLNPLTKQVPKNWNIGVMNTNGTLTKNSTLTTDINSITNSFNITGVNLNQFGGVNLNAISYSTQGTNGYTYVLNTNGTLISSYDNTTGTLQSQITLGSIGVTNYGISVNPTNGDIYVVFSTAGNNYVALIHNNITTNSIIMEAIPASPAVNSPQITYYNGYLYYVNNGDTGTNYIYTNSALTTSPVSINIGYTVSNPVSSTINNCVYFVREARFQNTLLLKYSQNSNGILTLVSSYDTGLNENNALVLGDDYYGNTLYTNASTNIINAYSFQSNKVAYTSSIFGQPPNYPIIAFPSPNQTVIVDSGPYEIFTYQEFLNQINSAFETCFQTLKTSLGATFLPTQAPSIIYNAQTRLFNLIVEGQYLTTNSDGSNQYQILMNNTLWNKFYFPSNTYNTTFQSIILQNYGINAIQGNGSATLPQFIYVQQEDSTIYAFYDLVRIIVGTTRIPVSGDGEGKTFSNNGTVSNSAINMITDIVPDTTTLTPGSVIIYIPAGILRWYNLYAQQPFDKIDLILSYETKDGSIYPIEVINGEFFSVKLEFKKGPGDF